MASSRSIQSEVDELKSEIAGLRSDYARLNGRATATKADRVRHFATIKENVTDTAGSFNDGAAAALNEISDHSNEFNDVVHGSSARTKRTVAAHPITAVAGAVTIGYLVGRLVR